jgi:hypothetical protein
MSNNMPDRLVVLDKNTKAETEILRFQPDEQMHVERLIEIVDDLRKRDDLSPEQLRTLATFLRAAKRLPMVTDGVSITISLINREKNGDWGYYSAFMSYDELELAVGESINCGSGHDHQVLNNLRIGCAWRGHDGVETGWEDWLDEFDHRVHDEGIEVSIEDNDSNIDWDAATSGAEYWDLLPDNAFR